MFRRFGTSLAISGDTVLVGAPGEDNKRGAAVLFVRDSAGVWKEHQRLEASDGKDPDELGPDHEFGHHVAIRGNVALVGAPGAGTAYVFVRDSDGSWRERRRLVADEGAARTTFGTSVALHDCVAAVGGSAALDSRGNKAGPGFVYAYDTCAGANWPRFSRITDPRNAQHMLYASALALTGSRLLVGSPSDREDTISMVHFYERTGAGYVLTQEIADPALSYSLFGHSIHVHGDIAVIGAPWQDSMFESVFRRGALYVLGRSDGTWTVRQKIKPQLGQQRPRNPDLQFWDSYGWAIALDEKHLVVAAPFGGIRGDFLPGYVYVYERAGVNFDYRRTLVGHEGLNSFGAALAVSGDDLVVGESHAFELIDENRGDGWGMGKAWAYDVTRLDELEQPQRVD